MSTTKSPWTVANNNTASASTQEQEIQPYNDLDFQQIRTDFQRVKLVSGTVATTAISLSIDPLVGLNETFLIDDACEANTPRNVLLPPSDSMIGKSVSFFIASQTSAPTDVYTFQTAGSTSLLGSRMIGTVLYDGNADPTFCAVASSNSGLLTLTGSAAAYKFTCKPLAGSKLKFTSAGAFWIVEGVISLANGSTPLPAFA